MNVDLNILSLSVIPEYAMQDIINFAEASPPGCFVELGVYRGGSAWHLAQIAMEQGRELHLFDTFTGIPERTEHDQQHDIGDFGDTTAEEVKALIPTAQFHIGMFPETMVETGPIAFAHIDCDQYVTCLAAIVCFRPRMVTGGVMLFDDYARTSGVTKAVDEVFGNKIHRTNGEKAYIIS